MYCCKCGKKENLNHWFLDEEEGYICKECIDKLNSLLPSKDPEYVVEDVLKMLQSNLNIAKYAAVEILYFLPRTWDTYTALKQCSVTIDNYYLQRDFEEYLSDLYTELVGENQDV